MRHTAISLLLLPAVIGCSSSADVNTAAPPPTCESPPVGQSMPATDGNFAELRGACRFQPGDVVANTVGTVPDLSPIKHVIIVMQENRSFDHYYSKLDGMQNLLPGDVAPASVTNPGRGGRAVPRYHESRLCVKAPAHEWSHAHVAMSRGNLDGFVLASSPGGERALGYYDESDFGFYYALARRFAVSARYFAPLPGPTTPNRFYLYFGTSFGYADAAEQHVYDQGSLVTNGLAAQLAEVRPPTILSAANGDFRAYLEDGSAVGGTLLPFLDAAVGVSDIVTFLSDVDNGNLPAVTLVNSKIGVDDEHGPTNPRGGQAFVFKIIEKVVNSALWASSAIFLTHDENGGYYDHVFPPKACPPDDYQSRFSTNVQDFSFDQYGFRVPLLVISPYAKPGFVSHVDADHTSILRFIEAMQKTGALTRRDANAWPLFDMFDFDNPAQLDEVPMDPASVEVGPDPCPGAPDGGYTGCPEAGCVPLSDARGVGALLLRDTGNGPRVRNAAALRSPTSRGIELYGLRLVGARGASPRRPPPVRSAMLEGSVTHESSPPLDRGRPLPQRLRTRAARSLRLALLRVDDLWREGRLRVARPQWSEPRVIPLQTLVFDDDVVLLDGRPVAHAGPTVCALLNKPARVTSTASDPKGKSDLFPYLRAMPPGCFPVGRLDRETTGLLLFTNDGDLANAVLRPEHRTPKTYWLWIDEPLGEDDPRLARLVEGVSHNGEHLSAADARIVAQHEDATELLLTLTEGRNRQIRRMCFALDLRLVHLHRRSIGRLTDEGLAVGSWRLLRPSEIETLWGTSSARAELRRTRVVALIRQAKEARAAGLPDERLEGWLSEE